MTFPFSVLRSRFCAVVLLLLCFGMPVQAAGTFRFLTTSVPQGTTDREYFAKVFTANAAGPVTFSISAGALPTGLNLNTQTGAIYGKPTVVEQPDVTITANDGVTTINLSIVKFKITASGGGGNSGASFVTTSLLDGRVGEAYTLTLQSQGGTGPFIWGAQDLPVGITLDGTTGVVSGTPLVAGTFFVTFTNNDTGESKNATTILPLTVFPADADADPDAIPPVLPDYMFKFETYMLNNGEVGTAFEDTYLTSGEEGTVTFSATGLPTGLIIDTDTGVVSGTPTVAGTFYLVITATDSASDTTISTNLPMWIAPSSSSNFYWNYFGLPAALYGMSYQGSVPIVVNTLNGNPTVTYSALGLPPGIIYNPTTGELSGTPSEVGLFPVVYTATDGSVTPQVLTLATDFVVLPPGGGDVGRLAVNLWIKKLSAKVNQDLDSAPNDSWQAQYIYNADRRTGKIFDPLTQSVLLALGSSTTTILAPAFTQSSSGVFSYKSAKGVKPGLLVKGTPTSQSLTLKVTSTELGTTLPAEMLDNNIILGSKGYKLKTFLDPKGKFLPTSSYRNASFVVATAGVKDTGSTKDNAVLGMYLADPSLLADFIFLECPDDNKNCNQPTVQIKLYDGVNVLLDKDITTLVATTRTEDKNALVSYKMKKVVKTDPASDNILSAFSFDSKKGLLKIALKDLVLASPLDSSQAHVGVELKIGSMSYFTSITLFETKQNSQTYSSKISKYATPFP